MQFRTIPSRNTRLVRRDETDPVYRRRPAMATSRSSSSRVMCKRIYCEHCEDYVSRSTYRRHQKERKTYEMENEDESSEVSYYLQASVTFTRQYCCWSKIIIQKLLRAMWSWLINSVIFLIFWCMILWRLILNS